MVEKCHVSIRQASFPKAMKSPQIGTVLAMGVTHCIQQVSDLLHLAALVARIKSHVALFTELQSMLLLQHHINSIS